MSAAKSGRAPVVSPDSLNGDVVPAIRVRHKIDRMDSTLKNTFERELPADVSFGLLQDLAN